MNLPAIEGAGQPAPLPRLHVQEGSPHPRLLHELIGPAEPALSLRVTRRRRPRPPPGPASPERTGFAASDPASARDDCPNRTRAGFVLARLSTRPPDFA